MSPGERAFLQGFVIFIQVLLMLYASYVSTLRGERAVTCQRVMRDCRRELRKLQARLRANESLHPAEDPDATTETARQAATQAAALAQALAPAETPAGPAARPAATATPFPRRTPARAKAGPRPHPDRWRKNTSQTQPSSTFTLFRNSNQIKTCRVGFSPPKSPFAMT